MIRLLSPLDSVSGGTFFAGSDSMEAVRFALDLLSLPVEIGSCGDGAEGCSSDTIVGGIVGFGLGSDLSSEYKLRFRLFHVITTTIEEFFDWRFSKFFQSFVDIVEGKLEVL